MSHSSKLVGTFVKEILSLRYRCGRCGWPREGAGRRLIIASHANGTLVDRVDLATPLLLSSQLATASRLTPPRSGLERSDFVLWPWLPPRRRPVIRRPAHSPLDDGGRARARCDGSRRQRGARHASRARDRGTPSSRACPGSGPASPGPRLRSRRTGGWGRVVFVSSSTSSRRRPGGLHTT
jgi:hypothetical protein